MRRSGQVVCQPISPSSFHDVFFDIVFKVIYSTISITIDLLNSF